MYFISDRYESKHIEEIISDISKRLNPKLLHIDDNMVGIDFSLKKLISLLSSHLNSILVVGIYEIDGKTSIAKIVYNEIQCEYVDASFLEDVREKYKKGHQLQLQLQQLFGDMVGKDIQLRDINEGVNIIKDMLNSKKVFIVIDDVDQLEQLKLLVGSPKWFGLGSRIIITTRDQHLFA